MSPTTQAFSCNVIFPLRHTNTFSFLSSPANISHRDTRWECAGKRSLSVKNGSLQAPRTRHEVPKRSSIKSALGFGFLSPKRGELSSNTGKLIPSPEARCACGTDKPYGKCCRPYHTAQFIPSDAEELLRSRYSAYAYRLPSYIMKTTHTSAIELDRGQWKREIMDFCKEYRFVGGVDTVEVQNPGPVTTRILFR